MTGAARPRIRTIDPTDYPWLLELIDSNRADRLTAIQRAEEGFVQGRWDKSALQRLSSGPGMLLAEVDGRRAGAALSSAPGVVTDGPAGRVNDIARDMFGDKGYFLYGPVIIDPAFRRRGLLRQLSQALLERSRYPPAVAFVQQDNTASLAAHTALGWQQVAEFVLEDGRRFSALWIATGRQAQQVAR